MKERECSHFVDSLVYLMEQTSQYCKVKGSQFLEDLNIGLTLDQYSALDTISFNQGICQRDLSKLILRDRSCTSRILNFLEQGDFIERRIETKGKRLVKKLYIASKGENILAKYQEKLKNLFAKVFEEISDEEFAVIRRGIEKMKNCISRYTEISL